MKNIFFLYLFFAVFSSFNAQETLEQSNKDLFTQGTVEEQFDYMIENSNRYQDYKVVKHKVLLDLKSHISDSLNGLKADLHSKKTEIIKQNSVISNLNLKLSETQNNLDKVNQEKESISFLGMPLKKLVFKSVMWGIIGVLMFLLILFIYKFKNSNTITSKSNSRLAEIEEEFEGHKKRSLEREQVLRRKLQDEINKQKYGD